MRKVFVGLSGGVDSGVSAALLKERGFDVVGAFIKIWQPEFIECTWREDRLDAMRVAAALGIPFREIDLSEEYKKEVVDSMVADYKRGSTPNPDVLCNRSIKFGHFLRWALTEGADYIATGHYANVHYERLTKSFILRRGKDTAKDQSYFLYRLGQKDLSHTLFPVGELTKPEVRAQARRFGLPVAAKPDSQGLCFVGDVSMRDFLARFIKVEAGAVVDAQGNEIGRHEGAALYTIGQRHGFTVHDSSAEHAPYFVIEVDVSRNRVKVSHERANATRKTIRVEDMHWIGGMPRLPFAAEAQARYRETPVKVNVSGEGTSVVVDFSEPHIAARGQSLVIYDGERCLGGGAIQ